MLGDFIDSLTARGYSVTETMVNMTTFSRDVMGAFEGVGILLQLEAEKRGVSLGTAVGQIAAEALAKMYPEFQRHSSKPKPGK